MCDVNPMYDVKLASLYHRYFVFFCTCTRTWASDCYLAIFVSTSRPDNSRCSIIGKSSLQITDVEETDAGSYTCRATNQEDSVDAVATLTVHGKCEKKLFPLKICLTFYDFCLELRLNL